MLIEPPYTGDVFWCEAFPGLHGHAAKDRFAVVVSPPNKLPDPADPNGMYLVVPTSSSTLSKYAVRLPNAAENAGTTSGLPRPCSAVCDEFKLVARSVLTKRVGDLRTVTIDRLQELVLLVLQERASNRPR